MPPMPGETTLNQQKRSAWNETTVVIDALGKLLIPLQENRVGLVIGCHATVAFALSRNPDTTQTDGVVIPAAGLPVSLSLGENGSIVKGPLYVKSGATPFTLTYWEAINNAT